MIEVVLTPAMFRNRACDCQWLAERAPNQRVRDILLDMSRTWTRLALEAEEWRRDNSPRSRLAKNATKDRPKIISPSPLQLPASPAAIIFSSASRAALARPQEPETALKCATPLRTSHENEGSDEGDCHEHGALENKERTEVKVPGREPKSTVKRFAVGWRYFHLDLVPAGSRQADKRPVYAGGCDDRNPE
jgi:hypothetical protein